MFIKCKYNNIKFQIEKVYAINFSIPIFPF